MSTGTSSPSSLIELLNLLQNQSAPAGKSAIKRQRSGGGAEPVKDVVGTKETRFSNRSTGPILNARFVEAFDAQTTPQRILEAFSRSGYPLDDLGCSCREGQLVLVGRVSTYYYLQMALGIARRFSHGAQIELQIQVADRARGASVEEAAVSTTA